MTNEELEVEVFRVKAWNDYENGEDRCWEFPSEEAERAYAGGWSNAVRYGNRNSDSIARYADSDVPPDWFDPSIAGESWDDY